MAKKPIPKEVVDRQMAMVDALAASRNLAEAVRELPLLTVPLNVEILARDALTKIRALDP